MTSTTARLSRLARTAGGQILLAALVLLGLAAPASAHDQLTASSPADGEVLTTAPSSLVLTYSAGIQTIGADVQVTGPDGGDYRLGDLTIQGSQVDVPLRTDPGSGAYQVIWRVISSDGHPIDGSFSYTLDVAAVAPTTEAPTPAQTATPSETPDPEPAPSSMTATSGQETSESASEADPGQDTPVLPWVVGALVFVLALGGGALLLRKRRRRS